MSDDGLATLHVRACELAQARGDVPDDGSGINGIWIDEVPDLDTDEQWFIAINADGEEREYRVTDDRMFEIPPFHAHFWYDTAQVVPAAICSPHEGEALFSGETFPRSTEDQTIASLEAMLQKLDELDEAVVLEAERGESDVE